MEINAEKAKKAINLIEFINKKGKITDVNSDKSEIKFCIPVKDLHDFIGINKEYFDAATRVLHLDHWQLHFELVDILIYYKIDHKKLNLIFKDENGKEI